MVERTCGNFRHCDPAFDPWLTCKAPAPMWRTHDTQQLVKPADDATHCAAWTAREDSNA